METRIILGYPTPAKDAKPFVVYLGNQGSEAEKAMAGSKAARFEIHQGQGRRKGNPNFDPEAVKAEVGLKHCVPFLTGGEGDDVLLFELENESQAFNLEQLLKELRAHRKEKSDAEAKAQADAEAKVKKK